MKIKVPTMVQDPLTCNPQHSDITFIEHIYIEDDYFFDGPATRRVAVIDFDPATGERKPGTKFYPPTKDRTTGYYYRDPEQVRTNYDIHDPEFIALNAFAVVNRTLALFEEDNTLGRKLNWGFDMPQLLIVPRAGELANAFYQRETHSLQLFFIPHNDQFVYTALSRDIIAHEAGHAIIDGIMPTLYNAVSPQALALHEAIADITALLMAFKSHSLRNAVLDKQRGSLEQSNEFSSIAEEFAQAIGHTGSLRDLCNTKALNQCEGTEPHELSAVLSGALYRVIQRLHAHMKSIIARRQPFVTKSDPEFSASGLALDQATDLFKSVILRAIDYLPAGNISFADYGRAVIAANRSNDNVHCLIRQWLCEEFIIRGISVCSDDLLKGLDPQGAEAVSASLENYTMDQLVSSDWVAYKFANRNRQFLGIPASSPFVIDARFKVSRDPDECLFKVSWTQPEPSFLGPHLIVMGTTLVIDWKSKKVIARLTSDRGANQRQARIEMLRRLVEEGHLRFGDDALGPDRKPLENVIRGENIGKAIRVRGTGNMLHISKEH